MEKSPSARVSHEAFWRKFCQTYWEKKPLAVRGVVSPIIQIDADRIFQLLLRYSDYCRKMNSTVGLKFYVNCQLQYPDEVLRLLPIEKDKSLEGYHSRMKKRFSDYCLVCDELLQVGGEIQDLIACFTQELFRHVGIPNKFAEIGLYLGNYRKTPFGVHVDGCGVMSLPVVGTKTFRLWKSQFVERNPDLKESFNYAAFKKHSTLLIAKPGDMTYWPSSYWHIAESDGAFHATWSIGFWMDQSYSDVLTQIVRPLLSKKMKSNSDARSIPFRKPRKDGFVECLPNILTRSISALRNLSENDLQDTFLRFWLEFASRKGIKNAPPPKRDARLRRGDWVQVKPDQPILWSRLSDGSLCLAINGALVEIPYSSKVAETIRALNSGKPCDLNRFWNDRSRKVLQTIYQNHAIVKTHGDTE